MALVTMALAVAATCYEGRVLGVHARVTAVQACSARSAHIELEGIPLGGRIAGSAELFDDGSLHLEQGLERALALRLCSVLGVDFDGDGKYIVVRLKLPLFGRRSVKLYECPVV
jgi:hypothetical protein